MKAGVLSAASAALVATVVHIWMACPKTALPAEMLGLTSEPALRPGALVIADDLDLFPDALQTYLDYVRDPVNGYVSVKIPIGDAMELSTRAE